MPRTAWKVLKNYDMKNQPSSYFELSRSDLHKHVHFMRQPVENLRWFSVCNQTQNKTGTSSFSVPMWDKCNLFQQLLILSLPCSSWTYLTTNQTTFYGHCAGQPALITGGFCSCKVFLLSTRPPLLTHAVTEHVNGMEFLCSFDQVSADISGFIGDHRCYKYRTYYYLRVYWKMTLWLIWCCIFMLRAYSNGCRYKTMLLVTLLWLAFSGEFILWRMWFFFYFTKH